MHMLCGAITPNGTAEEIEALFEPHREDWNEETNELTGWWDWYQIGGRWPRQLITSGDGWIGEESHTWSRASAADSSYVRDRKSLWTDQHVDSCPIKAIDWDAMGAQQVAELRQDYNQSPEQRSPFDGRDFGLTEDEFVRAHMQPFSVYRVVLPLGETFCRKEWRNKEWVDQPDFADRLSAALAEFGASHWLTLVDYHC